jgi:hypothetical protein
MSFVCRTTSSYILYLSFSRAHPDLISFLLSPNVLPSPPNNLPPCLKNNSLPASPTFSTSWPRILLTDDCLPTPQHRHLPIPFRPYPLSNQPSDPRSFPSLPPHATAPAPTRAPTSSAGLSTNAPLATVPSYTPTLSSTTTTSYGTPSLSRPLSLLTKTLSSPR